MGSQSISVIRYQRKHVIDLTSGVYDEELISSANKGKKLHQYTQTVKIVTDDITHRRATRIGSDNLDRNTNGNQSPRMYKKIKYNTRRVKL